MEYDPDRYIVHDFYEAGKTAALLEKCIPNPQDNWKAGTVYGSFVVFRAVNRKVEYATWDQVKRAKQKGGV